MGFGGCETAALITGLVQCSTVVVLHRYYFAGPRASEHEIFADNLPVLPDNIRLSADGHSLWVSSASTRFAGQWSALDELAPRPWARMLIAKTMPLNLLLGAMSGRHGLALRLDISSGRTLESLHDPEGARVTETSEVAEHGGHLYMGSYHLSYVARLKLP